MMAASARQSTSGARDRGVGDLETVWEDLMQL